MPKQEKQRIINDIVNSRIENSSDGVFQFDRSRASDLIKTIYSAYNQEISVCRSKVVQVWESYQQPGGQQVSDFCVSVPQVQLATQSHHTICCVIKTICAILTEQ